MSEEVTPTKTLLMKLLRGGGGVISISILIVRIVDSELFNHSLPVVEQERT